ncbi:MAG: hypothetical protein M3Y72_25535 [Acidobacteriota bacterium]|nr:hypothetical protein [Acidobacteriota bacterium]
MSLVPVHPITNRTAWLVGQIEGQEAAKGNVLPFNDLMIAAAIEQRVCSAHRQCASLPEGTRPEHCSLLRVELAIQIVTF